MEFRLSDESVGDYSAYNTAKAKYAGSNGLYGGNWLPYGDWLRNIGYGYAWKNINIYSFSSDAFNLCIGGNGEDYKQLDEAILGVLKDISSQADTSCFADANQNKTLYSLGNNTKWGEWPWNNINPIWILLVRQL